MDFQSDDELHYETFVRNTWINARVSSFLEVSKVVKSYKRDWVAPTDAWVLKRLRKVSEVTEEVTLEAFVSFSRYLGPRPFTKIDTVQVGSFYLVTKDVFEPFPFQKTGFSSFHLPNFKSKPFNSF
jgi:hypothetical protein